MALTLGCSVAVILGTVATAGPGHSHGVSQAIVTLSEQTLTVEWTADMTDLVGFERAPQSDLERSRLYQLERELRGGPPPFRPHEKGECDLQSSFVEGAFLSSNADDLPPSDGGARATAAADHLITARWQWQCKMSTNLRWIETNAFERHPSIVRIDIVVFSHAGQVGHRLTRRQPRATVPK